MRAAAPFALLVGLALLGAGCGDDPPMSKTEYERAFRSELEEFEEGFEYFRAQRGTRAELIEAFEDLRKLFLRTTDDLAQLDPPDEVRRAHERYVRGARAYANGPVKEAVEAWRRGEKRRASRLLSDPAELPVDAMSDTQEAREEFRAKGYDLGPLGLLSP